MRVVLTLLAALLVACQTWPAKATTSFDLVDMAGEGQPVYSSADHLGKPIVLEFYFAGCPACKKNAPQVQDLQARYHGDKAQVVEVSIDCDQDDYDYWFRQHKPTAPVLNDCERSLVVDLQVTRYPTTVVLDRQHRVVYETVGVWSPQTKAKIEQLIGGTK